MKDTEKFITALHQEPQLNIGKTTNEIKVNEDLEKEIDL